ncbi:MAG TPA: hypothetical protein VH475_02540 [Tepidisphaeraceae bacterium]
MLRQLLRVVCVAGVLALSLAVATPAFGRTPKKYQVTGKVLEVSDDLIVVQKDDEKWEIGRGPSTKIEGKLAVGAKVTVQYTMSAATVEVSADKAGGAAADKKGK